jgi:hypothetical protein
MPAIVLICDSRLKITGDLGDGMLPAQQLNGEVMRLTFKPMPSDSGYCVRNSLMLRIWIRYSDTPTGGESIDGPDVASGVSWINWIAWVDMHKEEFPIATDLINRMTVKSPFAGIEKELRLIAGYVPPADVKVVTLALLKGIQSRPDKTESIAITHGTESADEEKDDAE